MPVAIVDGIRWKQPVKKGVLLDAYPSDGYGYRELETVQGYAAKFGKIQADKEALKVPELIYFCRKLAGSDKTPDKSVTKEIDRAVRLLLDGKTAEARALAEKISSSFPERAPEAEIPR